VKGRKPKPTARQIAEGDPRRKGVRKLLAKLESEPKAASGLPDCPSHLTGRARVAWEFWTEELAVMKLDKRPDAMMLEGACVSYARAVAADIQIDREGMTVEESTIDEESGEKIVLKIRAHPAVTISNVAWRQLRAFCSEFGFSPVSRTRLTIEKHDSGEADLMKLLGGARDPRKSAPVN
jgi:P27 family predicted phage terminase small subunit